MRNSVSVAVHVKETTASIEADASLDDRYVRLDIEDDARGVDVSLWFSAETARDAGAALLAAALKLERSAKRS